MLDVPPVDQTFNRTSVNPQSGLAIYNAKFLQNTATGTDALTIMGNPSNYSSSINIGYNSTSSNGGLAIGKGANANQGTAIGYNAQASGINSIQIGNGSNSTANSLQVGSYQLLNTSTGKIPYQRINTITDSNSGGGLKYWTGTRAQYNAITTKDANTLYNITDDSDITYSMLELLYPVGSIYIGTMATCPLATLGIGTWTLKTSRFLVEKYSDSSNWWELYSDGWCQQGGIVNVTSAPFSVDLLKSYANTNYSFFAFTADTYTGTSSRVVRGYSTNKTNSSFDIQYTSTAAGSTGNVTTEYVNWYACGYTSTVSQLNQWERVS